MAKSVSASSTGLGLTSQRAYIFTFAHPPCVGQSCRRYCRPPETPHRTGMIYCLRHDLVADMPRSCQYFFRCLGLKKLSKDSMRLSFHRLRQSSMAPLHMDLQTSVLIWKASFDQGEQSKVGSPFSHYLGVYSTPVYHTLKHTYSHS
jgi:hypothetical protein